MQVRSRCSLGPPACPPSLAALLFCSFLLWGLAFWWVAAGVLRREEKSSPRLQGLCSPAPAEASLLSCRHFQTALLEGTCPLKNSPERLVVHSQGCALHRPEKDPRTSAATRSAPPFLALGDRPGVDVARERSPRVCGLCCLASWTWHVSGVRLSRSEWEPSSSLLPNDTLWRGWTFGWFPRFGCYRYWCCGRRRPSFGADIGFYSSWMHPWGRAAGSWAMTLRAPF